MKRMDEIIGGELWHRLMGETPEQAQRRHLAAVLPRLLTLAHDVAEQGRPDHPLTQEAREIVLTLDGANDETD
jgi:hypothetical protein